MLIQLLAIWLLVKHQALSHSCNLSRRHAFGQETSENSLTISTGKIWKWTAEHPSIFTVLQRKALHFLNTVIWSNKYCEKLRWTISLSVEMDYQSISLSVYIPLRKTGIITAKHRRLRKVFPFSMFDGKRKWFIRKKKNW